ncbi:MAG: AMP-binding protein [Caldilineaceae bacterium]
MSNTSLEPALASAPLTATRTTFLPMAPAITVAQQTFSRHATQNLSFMDQLLFEHFGQGPIATVPYSNIHHPFEVQAAAHPHAIAAQHQGESITYGELERQANRLAALLADHGVTNGDNVALFLQRSIPMLVGILASLKVGAAYVPQDARVAPPAQMAHIIDTTSAQVILTLSSLQHLVPVPDGCVVIAIDELLQQPFTHDDDYRTPFTPARPIAPNDRCFILFTSGTTGNPNGVQVTHGNVCNILLTEPGTWAWRPA